MNKLRIAFATFPVLHTERLVLRAIEQKDRADMFRIMSDTQVMRYFGSEPMVMPEEAEMRIEDIRKAFAERSGVRWAITWREGGDFLGTCGFWRLIPEHFRAEVGYELAPEWWGKGIMPEAIGAALNFAFTRMGLHSIEAQIDPANTASRRVLEKLGFVQEGYFHENYYDTNRRAFTDTAIFSLVKPKRSRRAAR